MAKLCLKVVNKYGNIKQEVKGENEISLVYFNKYEEGDSILFTTSKVDDYYILQVDDAMGEAFTYIKKEEIKYQIPFGEKKVSYSPKTFVGEVHLLTAREATKEEIASYKNLAKNIMDQHGDTGCYPHAFANVETRGEAVFAARNAINGNRFNASHGPWPYESWGINMQDDAEFTLDFGRKVLVDKIVLYTRADFPHDNWWEKITITFSDGSSMKVDLKKSDKAHIIDIKKKEMEWIKLSELIKADDPSPFPALTQFEVYGVEA